MIYMTDEIVIIEIKNDENGLMTETELLRENAKVYDYNRFVIDANGKEVLSEMKIDLKKNSNVKYGSKIKIKKKNGITYDLPDKKYTVKKMARIGAFQTEYIRVFV